MKLKKRKKASRMHGKGMGTHGTGSRKNKRKSGHKGGCGLAGTGKRADHKKTLMTKLYGNNYFGKQGITSRKTKRDTRKRINIGEIQKNPEKYEKKEGNKIIVNLPQYKILGDGEVTGKLIIRCLEASQSVIEKVKKAGGEIIIKEKKKIETPFVTNPKHELRKKK